MLNDLDVTPEKINNAVKFLALSDRKERKREGGPTFSEPPSKNHNQKGVPPSKLKKALRMSRENTDNVIDFLEKKGLLSRNGSIELNPHCVRCRFEKPELGEETKCGKYPWYDHPSGAMSCKGYLDCAKFEPGEITVLRKENKNREVVVFPEDVEILLVI